MPIRISSELPAFKTLGKENIFVMSKERAEHQDIRPLKVIILNIMPKKIETECQLLRLLSNTPLQVDIELLQMASHVSRNTSHHHLEAFYKTFDEIKDRRYDGMIVTGAPVELLEYEQVDYWKEITEIFEWSKTHVFSTIYICWAAQAGLYYHYGIPKYDLPEKLFGVFPHVVDRRSNILMRGFDDVFMAPHSRNTEVFEADIRACDSLELLAVSPEVGVFAAATPDRRQVFVVGHLEYDADTLANEYFRDVNKGLDIAVPKNYFPNDDPTKPPVVTWRAAGQLLYTNWLNYYVYQATPYDLRDL